MQGRSCKYTKKVQKLNNANNNWLVDQLTIEKTKCITFRFFIYKSYNP